MCVPESTPSLKIFDAGEAALAAPAATAPAYMSGGLLRLPPRIVRADEACIDVDVLTFPGREKLKALEQTSSIDEMIN